jgi:hypothetical protein
MWHSAWHLWFDQINANAPDFVEIELGASSGSQPLYRLRGRSKQVPSDVRIYGDEEMSGHIMN